MKAAHNILHSAPNRQWTVKKFSLNKKMYQNMLPNCVVLVFPPIICGLAAMSGDCFPKSARTKSSSVTGANLQVLADAAF